jgi:PhnB protein
VTLDAHAVASVTSLRALHLLSDPSTKEERTMATTTKPLGFAVRRHQNFHSVTPYLIVSDATKAAEFYQRAFGAQELMPPIKDPTSNKVVHQEIRIGNSPVMLTDEIPDYGLRGPNSLGGTTVQLHVYVEDADAIFKQAVGAGAKSVIPVTDTFYGTRSGRVQDPYGHLWSIETLKEDVSPEEIKKRAGDFIAKHKK